MINSSKHAREPGSVSFTDWRRATGSEAVASFSSGKCHERCLCRTILYKSMSHILQYDYSMPHGMLLQPLKELGTHFCCMSRLGRILADPRTLPRRLFSSTIDPEKIARTGRQKLHQRARGRRQQVQHTLFLCHRILKKVLCRPLANDAVCRAFDWSLSNAAVHLGIVGGAIRFCSSWSLCLV